MVIWPMNYTLFIFIYEQWSDTWVMKYIKSVLKNQETDTTGC
jgi:hypothetical protein